jgi:ATP-dependent RNA circularization protein (DNA/RNA ligase family)
MNKYPKIQTVFLRDPDNNYKTLLEGQYAMPEFEYLKDNVWYFTEKIDGTNIRVQWNGEDIYFLGRTEDAQIPPFLLKRLQDVFPTDCFIDAEISAGTCLYGEGYGARIQKGGGSYIPDGVDFILFDIKIADWWLERENIEDIAAKFGIDVVPIIDRGCLEDAVERVRCGFRSAIAYSDINAEGLVMKPEVELMTRGGNRIITKIKYKDFPR